MHLTLKSNKANEMFSRLEPTFSQGDAVDIDLVQGSKDRLKI